MSKLVSLRLEDELASWVEAYREKRGWSRAELISAALRSFRQDCEGGVPDLPPSDVPSFPKPKARPALGPSGPAQGRQQRVNEMIERARAAKR